MFSTYIAKKKKIFISEILRQEMLIKDEWLLLL